MQGYNNEYNKMLIDDLQVYRKLVNDLIKGDIMKKFEANIYARLYQLMVYFCKSLKRVIR